MHVREKNAGKYVCRGKDDKDSKYTYFISKSILVITGIDCFNFIVDSFLKCFVTNETYQNYYKSSCRFFKYNYCSLK